MVIVRKSISGFISFLLLSPLKTLFEPFLQLDVFQLAWLLMFLYLIFITDFGFGFLLAIDLLRGEAQIWGSLGKPIIFIQLIMLFFNSK